MDNSKGKGRANIQDDESQSGPNEPPQEISMLSRVAASASGLTRNAFTTPNSNELNDRATAALSNDGKGQSSIGGGSGSSAWAESSKTSQQSAHPQASGPTGIRTGHSEQHVLQSEDELSSFLDGIDSFTPSEDLGVAQPVASRRDSMDEAWARAQSAQGILHQQTENRTVTEQETRDGEDVLAILSETSTVQDHFEAPEEEQENYDWGLSSEQITQLRAMTKELLPPPEPHSSISPEHPLNLAPNAEGQDLATRDHWREQWEGVLTRYTDEVWGGLLPLVKEARKEVEDIRNGTSGVEQPTALRRLGAILGHLQGR